MNWIKIGERLVNLDLVTFVHLREDGTAVQVDHADEDTSFYDGEEAGVMRGYFDSLVADGTIRDLTPGARIGSPPAEGAGSEGWRTAASLGEALRGILAELDEVRKALGCLGREAGEVYIDHDGGLVVPFAYRPSGWPGAPKAEAAGGRPGPPSEGEGRMGTGDDLQWTDVPEADRGAFTLRAGMMIRYRGGPGPTDEHVYEALVGDVNEDGGKCGCCHYGGAVVAWAWAAPWLAGASPEILEADRPG